MNQDAKRLVMFDALLAGGDLSRLVEAAAGVLGNPVAVCDMGLGTIAVSSDLVDDPEWGKPNAGMDAPDVRQATLKGDFRKVYASDKTVVGDYHGAQQRYLAARIRRKNHVLGHVIVLERNSSFSAEDQALLPDICKTIGFALAPDTDMDQLSERHGHLFLEILEGRLQDASAIEARVQSANLHLPTSMTLLLFRPVSDAEHIPARHLRERLKRVFPDGVSIVREDDVILVVSAAAEDLEENAASATPFGTTSVGASYPFTSLASLKRAFEQAEAAVRLSGSEKHTAGLTRYQDVVAMHLGECVSATKELDVFEHPAVELLIAAGKQDKADYVRDIETYLYCGRNASAAAKALHVHKNTMYYRLQRIQDIAGIDLSDAATCFALQLSVAMRGKQGD